MIGDQHAQAAKTAIMKVMLALIGFREAGSTFARAAGWGNAALVWDIDASRQPVMVDLGILAAEDAKEALMLASIVLSPVTADAVLAPVDPSGVYVPLLVAGSCAAGAARLLRQAGFADLTVVGAEVGQASAVKMIRSVVVKWIEALTAERTQAADAAGVTNRVLASLNTSEKAWSWTKRAAYNLERMATHGLRRATEMGESVKILEAVGAAPVMTHSTVERQRSAWMTMP